MAVRENPYNKWQRDKTHSDYRSTDTQVISLVRQQLSQPEYLTTRNRINPGPLRNKRAAIADSTPQIPHVFGSEDIWGWQPWTTNFTVTYPSGLKETLSPVDIPGATYYPYNKVGGATYTEMEISSSSYVSDLIETGAPVSISPKLDSINGIPVDTSNIGPTKNGYVLVYNSIHNKFNFVPANVVVGLSDDNSNISDVDLGSF